MPRKTKRRRKGRPRVSTSLLLVLGVMLIVVISAAVGALWIEAFTASATGGVR